MRIIDLRTNVVYDSEYDFAIRYRIPVKDVRFFVSQKLWLKPYDEWKEENGTI